MEKQNPRNTMSHEVNDEKRYGEHWRHTSTMRMLVEHPRDN